MQDLFRGGGKGTWQDTPVRHLLNLKDQTKTNGTEKWVYTSKTATKRTGSAPSTKNRGRTDESACAAFGFRATETKTKAMVAR